MRVRLCKTSGALNWKSAARMLKGGLDMECIDWGGNPAFFTAGVCVRARSQAQARACACVWAVERA